MSKHTKKLLKTTYKRLENSRGQVRRLYEKALELERINFFLMQHLDEPLRDHCKAARIDKGKLVIVADSAAWLAQLNYLIPDLLFQLRTHPELSHLGKITCKVTVPLQENKVQTTRQQMELTCANAQYLQQTASGIKNPRLRKAIEKISTYSKT